MKEKKLIEVSNVKLNENKRRLEALLDPKQIRKATFKCSEYEGLFDDDITSENQSVKSEDQRSPKMPKIKY